MGSAWSFDGRKNLRPYDLGRKTVNSLNLGKIPNSFCKVIEINFIPLLFNSLLIVGIWIDVCFSKFNWTQLPLYFVRIWNFKLMNQLFILRLLLYCEERVLQATVQTFNVVSYRYEARKLVTVQKILWFFILKDSVLLIKSKQKSF